MKTAVSFALILCSILIFPEALVAQKAKSSGQLAATKESRPAENTAKATRFESITPISDGKATWITWQMEAEFGNVGFNVYRVGRAGGPELLTPDRIVAGAAMRAKGIPQFGQNYFFYDPIGDGTSAYYVETVGLRGQRLASQQVYPQYVPSLSAATGLSEEQMLNTTFRPTRLENVTPVFTKDIVTEIDQYRQLADPSTHRTVISQPGVARIGVKNEGLYRVTNAQLAAAGFNVATDPTNWQLYVEGVEQRMLVGAGYIEFYGKGTDTPETDIRQYYLLNGSSPGKRMTTAVAHPNTSTVLTRTFSQTFVKKERTQYAEGVFNDEAENYFGRSITTNPAASLPVTFNLSNVDFATPTASMQLRFQGYSDGNHLVEVVMNGETLAPAQGMGTDNFVTNYSIPTSLLREGANSIKFKTMGDPGDFVFFDTVRITFNRSYVALENRLHFYTQNYRGANVGGFTSANIRVFDLTRETDPVLMNNLTAQQNGSTFSVYMPPARGRSFFAVEDSAILAPVSVTANNPELVGIPTNGADLIILSYKDFMTQAETWANYRRGQGFSVKVIEVSELFDEFNFGTFSSTAVKTFLQYAYQSWQVQPRYVLLLGDASWDSRNYENTGYWNYIPPKMVATIYSETASDDALTDFNNDGLAEIPIGRVPVRTVADLNIVFTKTVNWETSLTSTSMNRGALFAHDFNQGYLFDLMSQRLRDQLPAGTPSTFVFRGEANANTNLITAMNTGKYIVNYSGHGTAGSWGGNPVFFNSGSIPNIGTHAPSIYTMLTCLNGYYHWLYFPSISEFLLTADNKGAAIAWASSGLTLPNFQEDMATRFYLKISEGNITRMGDLVRDAKTAVAGSDLRYSWALLGDPMLKVR